MKIATENYGIEFSDLVIDPMAMPIGADTSHGRRTLDTIGMIHQQFGLNMTLGASNVSFGMPEREAIAAAFLPMAMALGLTSAIADARSSSIVKAIKATDLLLDRDPWAAPWRRTVVSFQREPAGP